MELTYEEIRLLDSMDGMAASEWFKRLNRKSNNRILEAAYRLYEAGAAEHDDAVLAVLMAVEQVRETKAEISQAETDYFVARKSGEKAARAVIQTELIQQHAARKAQATQAREKRTSAVLRKQKLPFPAALLPDSVGPASAADRALRSRGCVVSVNTGNIDYRLDKAKRHKR